MYKKIALILIAPFCFSCNLFEPEKQPKMISFVFTNVDKTIFQEIKVIAYTVENGQHIAYDSVYHYPLKTPSIPYYSSAEIAFLDQSFQVRENGLFEAIAVKEDSTVFRNQIGKIEKMPSRRRFEIELSNLGIALK